MVLYMKKTMVLILRLFLSVSLLSQYLTPVDSASAVPFKIKNLRFNTGGSFSGLAGTINFSPDNPDGCSFDVHIDANTVNTDNDMRDGHLRGEDYFDVKNHPQIRFVSQKVTGSKKN